MDLVTNFEKSINEKLAAAHELSIKNSQQDVQEPLPPKRFAGLGNQGATCYMNSLL